MHKRNGVILLAVLSALLLPAWIVGCQSDAQTGALIGTAIGAAAGAGLDHNKRGRGALIGAAAGAVGGYIVGNEADKQKAKRDQGQY